MCPLQIRLRKTGNTAGTSDVYYKTPEGKRFRSKREVVNYLGLTPVAEARRSGPAGSSGRSGQRNPWTMSKQAAQAAGASSKPRTELAASAAALAAKCPLDLPASCAHGVIVHRSALVWHQQLFQDASPITIALAAAEDRKQPLLLSVTELLLSIGRGFVFLCTLPNVLFGVWAPSTSHSAAVS